MGLQGELNIEFLARRQGHQAHFDENLNYELIMIIINYRPIVKRPIIPQLL